MKWEKIDFGWRSTEGYEIVYGTVNMPTKKSYTLSASVVFNPNGEILMVCDNLTQAKEVAERDLKCG